MWQKEIIKQPLLHSWESFIENAFGAVIMSNISQEDCLCINQANMATAADTVGLGVG